MLIDSHCHIHDTLLFTGDREQAYQRAIDTGVRIVLVGTSEKDSREAIDFAATHEGVWAVIGVHPHETRRGWQAIKGVLEEKPARLVGVGEVGLDYFHENSPRDLQIRAFEEQLQWAVDHDLPVSFHVREAFDDFWPIFDAFHGVRGVLHSFTDSQKNLEAGLKRGLYIGVNGISTFTKSEVQQAMFRSIPLDRLLVETDAPFLTPVPFRGRVNEPAYVTEITKHQAATRGMPFGDIAAISTANAEALFALR